MEKSEDRCSNGGAGIGSKTFDRQSVSGETAHGGLWTAFLRVLLQAMG